MSEYVFQYVAWSNWFLELPIQVLPTLYRLKKKIIRHIFECYKLYVKLKQVICNYDWVFQGKKRDQLLANKVALNWSHKSLKSGSYNFLIVQAYVFRKCRWILASDAAVVCTEKKK